MYIDKDFQPILRFMVVSDIHYDDTPGAENERFAKAIRIANRLSAEQESYKRLDALYVVGDFATSGSEIQMKAVKQTIDENVLPETQVSLMMASHEYSTKNGGEAAALERFARIFNLPPDDHRVINGFHFIGVTSTKGCHFDEAKRAWVAEQLEIAAKDSPRKPIFFFQHPHITDTVYGSIAWGEDELTSILMNYPQIIDFSGHSHAPINDPRSVHQRHFTCLGTGTLSYFELDEFDKIYGTVPPDSRDAAQMLIVEADKDNRVRVYPYDVLTDGFFKKRWAIDEPWEPNSFIYTDERLKSTYQPYFPTNAELKAARLESSSVELSFTQACDEEELYVDDYVITLRDESAAVVRRAAVWSGYYFSSLPESLSVVFDGLESDTAYEAEVTANSFWRVKSRNSLKLSFRTKQA